ncbi:MAG: discoidin domain-containing protein [Firmicutes bacterium]|nr:discoidin domain-containing protein [Bacillota bacterium]
MKRILGALAGLTVTVLVMLGNGGALAWDKSYTAYMAGNSHIDAAWLWPMTETVGVVRNTFNSQLKLLDNNPDFRFTQSSSLYYQWMKEYYPALFDGIKGKVAGGQWEIVGGQVIEPDLNITSGESLVRQTLYGKRYFRDEFGVDVKIGYVPDVFGFTYALPQILKKSGIDYFVTTKLNWNDTNPFPHEYFKWKGLDGSELVTYKPRYDYPTTFNRDRINATLYKPDLLGIKSALALYGTGDHGGGPTQDNLNRLRIYGSDPAMPNVNLKRIDEYFADTAALTGKLPVWDNEMYLEYHRGTYTTQAAIKKYNRLGEIRAEEAEKFASVASWLGAIAYPYDKITKAWGRITTNQFHDILPGSSIHSVYVEAWDDAELALNYLNASLDNALEGILSRVDTEGHGAPVVVFNPLSFARNSLVETEAAFPTKPASVRVYDPAGLEVPVQVESISDTAPAVVKLVFVADDVPSLGYKVYRIVPGNGRGSYSTGLSAGSYTMENNRYRVEISSATGNISRIYDKINVREVLSGEGNVLQIYEDTPRNYDAWNVDRDDMSAVPTELNKPTSISLVEAGPVRAVYRVKKTWSGSAFYQDITLYSEIDRIDVKMTVDWNESHKLLKVAFPLSVNPPKATYEIAYGAVERSTTRDNSFDAARFEVPGHRWADLSENGYGVSILNDSKYGWDALNNRIRLTLLRAPKSPDPNADMGHHEFTYSIYPHGGDWKAANTVRKGYELNYPLIALSAMPHAGSLPASFSFVSVDQPNVVISVVKKSEESASNDLIVRMYETQGKEKTTAHLTFAAKVNAAKEVNLLEDPIGDAGFNDHQLTVELGKYEIKTFRVSLDSPFYVDTRPMTARVDLSPYFNRDGASYNANRADGNLDGLGNTLAAELLPAEVNSEGIGFRLGSTADGAKNVVDCLGQTIPLPSGAYYSIYLLGAAAGGKNTESGKLVVNYEDGTSSTKWVSFRDWGARLGGWGLTTVDDTIGYGLTHRHKPGGDDLLTDNYLFRYSIDTHPSKRVKSITLPNNGKMKLLAVSLVDYPLLVNPGKTMHAITLPPRNRMSLRAILAVSKGGQGIGDFEAPARVTGVTAQGRSSYVKLVWNAATDDYGVDHYNIYRGAFSGFTPDAASFIGESVAPAFVDDSIPANAAYFYRIEAVDIGSNVGALSDEASAKVLYAQNVALNRVAAADGYMPGESPDKAVDGVLVDNSKWCYNSFILEPHWWKVDLGDIHEVDKFVIKHAGAGGETPSWNTSDFRIQYSATGDEPWVDLVTVAGNNSSVTSHYIEPLGLRYLRLYVTRPTNTNDTAARIYEFEAYAQSATPPPEPPLPTSNVQVNLRYAFNQDGMSYDSRPGDGNLDGVGWSYSADLMPDTVILDGVEYQIGPKADGTKNVVMGASQSIPLPYGKFSSLRILGASTNGDKTGTFYVTYTDGTTAEFNLTMTDWCGAARHGEATALTFNHRHSQTADQIITNHVFGYTLNLDSSRAVSSVTFPGDNNMKVLAITLVL